MNKSLLKAAIGHFNKYQAWLEKQPLSEHSKRAYRSRLNHFLGYLGSSNEDYRDPFKDETERDYILKDYKRFLKQKHKASPSTQCCAGSRRSLLPVPGFAKNKSQERRSSGRSPKSPN